jgi:hypothetical protein
MPIKGKGTKADLDATLDDLKKRLTRCLFRRTGLAFEFADGHLQPERK